MHGRWYDPNVGRFISSDAKGEYLYGSGEDAVNYVWVPNSIASSDTGDSDSEVAQASQYWYGATNTLPPLAIIRVPEDCNDIAIEIAAVVADLAERYQQARADIHSIPDWDARHLGSKFQQWWGTKFGHEAKYKGQQTRLRRLLQKWNDQDCNNKSGGSGLPSNLGEWLNKPYPNPPNRGLVPLPSMQTDPATVKTGLTIGGGAVLLKITMGSAGRLLLIGWGGGGGIAVK